MGPRDDSGTEFMNSPAAVGVSKIGIVVEDVDAAVQRYEELLSIDGWRRALVSSDDQDARFIARGNVANVEAAIAWTDVGGVELELIEPRDTSSTFAQFLERRGPGVHHIRLAVSNYHDAANHFAKAGIAEELWAEVLGNEFRIFNTVHNLGVDLQLAPGKPQQPDELN